MPGYVLHVVPPRAAPPAFDRSATVGQSEARPVEFPVVEVATAGAVRVLKVVRDALPLAQLTAAFDAGTDVKVPEELADLGAQTTTATDADFVTISASVLSAHAQQAADILTSLADGPRVFIASGDVAALRVIPREARDPLPASVVRAAEREQFHVVESPSATQAHILLTQDLDPSVANDPLPAQLVVSYMLRSRLMDNLRSAKGWSYEIYPFALDVRRGGAAARFSIPVQTDKVAETIVEVRKEIARLQDEPVSGEYLVMVRAWLEGGLTAGLMSLEALNAQLLELARNDLPPDYYRTAIARLATFTPADVQAVARELLHADRLSWTITGPREAIEGELRELNSAQ